MKIDKSEYKAPQICDVLYVAEGVLCGSDTSEGYNPGTDFGGSDDWS